MAECLICTKGPKGDTGPQGPQGVASASSKPYTIEVPEKYGENGTRLYVPPGYIALYGDGHGLRAWTKTAGYVNSNLYGTVMAVLIPY